jgi:hypothetical protein
MAYRNDLDALEARYAALEAEVADKVRARDEAATMLAEARDRDRARQVAADIASGGPARRRRRAINIGVTVAAAAILLAGVVRLATRPSSYEEKMERVVKQLEKFTDQVCVCKDAACAQKVNDEMSKWGQEMAREAEMNDRPPSPEYMRRVEKTVERMSKCMTEAYKNPEPTLEANPYGSQEGGANSRSNN